MNYSRARALLRPIPCLAFVSDRTPTRATCPDTSLLAHSCLLDCVCVKLDQWKRAQVIYVAACKNVRTVYENEMCVCVCWFLPLLRGHYVHVRQVRSRTMYSYIVVQAERPRCSLPTINFAARPVSNGNIYLPKIIEERILPLDIRIPGAVENKTLQLCDRYYRTQTNFGKTVTRCPEDKVGCLLDVPETSSGSSRCLGTQFVFNVFRIFSEIYRKKDRARSLLGAAEFIHFGSFTYLFSFTSLRLFIYLFI